MIKRKVKTNLGFGGIFGHLDDDNEAADWDQHRIQHVEPSREQRRDERSAAKTRDMCGTKRVCGQTTQTTHPPRTTTTTGPYDLLYRRRSVADDEETDLVLKGGDGGKGEENKVWGGL
jgi:hypothetical protein